jgi:hypothetical protein
LDWKGAVALARNSGGGSFFIHIEQYRDAIAKRTVKTGEITVEIY